MYCSRVTVVCMALVIVPLLFWLGLSCRAQNSTGVSEELSPLTQLDYWSAIGTEVKAEGDIREQWRQLISGHSTGAKGAKFENAAPKFGETIAAVEVYRMGGWHYLQDNRPVDAKRMFTKGTHLAEKILEQYPKAKFASGLHETVAAMLSWPPNHTHEDLASALAHIDKALTLDAADQGKPGSEATKSTRQLAKASILTDLGDEVAALSLYDTLRESKVRDVADTATLNRAKALAKFGRNEEAKTELERIVREYPADTFYAKEAAKALQTMAAPGEANSKQ